MERKVYGIFVAGGSGTRMGTDIPKQFLKLGGVPVLRRTIERFLEAIPGLNVITVIPSSQFQYWKDLCEDTEFHCPQILVAGGITRFHSVQNALAKVPDGAVVMVHDGVRPLVPVALLRDLVNRMSDCRALVPVTPMVDTLKWKDGTTPDPDRSKIVGAQTPQLFLSEELKEAYRLPYDVRFTDDASVAVAAGIPVTYVDGDRLNIKITTPSDLILAEAIISLGSL